ncbi:MAG: N-acetyltransferase family protein [Halodesulfurarchaeum sp.]
MPRTYRGADAERLWELKQGFERGLGQATGDDRKARTYEEKLTPRYRDRYLDWVDRCTTENPRSVLVAERDRTPVGYVFVLPESLAHIWDGAVINELYVEPRARGDEIGTTLLESALGVAREQDLPLDRVLLDVDRENGPASELYDSFGFDHWGEILVRDLPADAGGV